VNLSSRLEGLNKDYGTHILVNETTYARAKDAGFVFRELDLIRVKGKKEPVVICELVCDVKSLTPEIEMLLDCFADARKLYEERRWTEAQSAFQTIIDRWPEDGPARAYWIRCQEYLFDEPPANWDGVFTMTHK
jgi:adenylate cyclase